MGDNLPPTSPWTYDAKDYIENEIRIVIPFNETPETDGTHLINGPGLVHHDPDCVYHSIIIGPPQGVHITLPVPDGDSSYTLAQINAVGLTTFEQLNTLSVTAIP